MNSGILLNSNRLNSLILIYIDNQKSISSRNDLLVKGIDYLSI